MLMEEDAHIMCIALLSHADKDSTQCNPTPDLKIGFCWQMAWMISPSIVVVPVGNIMQGFIVLLSNLSTWAMKTHYVTMSQGFPSEERYIHSFILLSTSLEYKSCFSKSYTLPQSYSNHMYSITAPTCDTLNHLLPSHIPSLFPSASRLNQHLLSASKLFTLIPITTTPTRSRAP